MQMKCYVLIYNMMSASILKEGRHPQTVMKELGITYQRATPQSMYDSWMFWNCSNLPVDLPSYIDGHMIDPMEFIGHGLSEASAISIRDYNKQGD